MARARSFEPRRRDAADEGVATGPESAVVRLRLHGEHAFGGMEIIESVAPRVIVARSDCGLALDVADAVFQVCPECSGGARGCRRCGGTGEVVDHAALEWQRVEEWRERHGGLI